MSSHDTIAAIATPSGRGGIGVLRISGSRAAEIAVALLGILPAARTATFKSFRSADGSEIDSGLALYFPAPRSFTGEDVLELHGHGGIVVMDMLLARVLSIGARHAAPGEFTQRAFLNDKLDLAQAEAIADLIDSASHQAARAAIRSLQGVFSVRVGRILEKLVEARMYIEAAIDFPEEEIDFLKGDELKRRLDSVASAVSETLSDAKQGALLRDGMNVVIAGKPNAGKSSLLNALAGYEAAIVTAIPGTTRDVLRERITIDGMPLHILDTAGLRETADVLETEGIRRAQDAMASADRILYVVDSTDELVDERFRRELEALPPNVPVTLVYSKIDLGKPKTVSAATGTLRLSALTGEGLPDLHQHLKQCMGLQESSATTFSARRRHLDALRRAEQRIQSARQLLIDRKAGELMAEELRLAQQDIGEITGEFTADDLLGRIFASFCIGK